MLVKIAFLEARLMSVSIVISRTILSKILDIVHFLMNDREQTEDTTPHSLSLARQLVPIHSDHLPSSF